MRQGRPFRDLNEGLRSGRLRGALKHLSSRWIFEELADAGAWAVALGVGVLLRYEDIHQVRFGGYAVAAVLAGCMQWLAGRCLGLYEGRWRRGSFEEISVLARAAGLSAVAVVVVEVLAVRLVPLSSAVGAAPLALVLMGHARYGLRLISERRLRPHPEGAKRVVVFGAGEGGAQVVNAMLRSPTSPFVPVALLDDDPRKSRLRIAGVAVRGTRRVLADVVLAEQASTVVIAIPSADAALIQDITRRAEPLGVEVRVLPGIGELFHRAVGVSDIRPVTPADLLGRREAEIDIGAVSGYLTGMRVLVTGAGGSIGSELCRQVRRLNPSCLIMLDRDESALHALQLSLEGRALLDCRELVVADIRDRRRMHEVFAEHQPDVVFHAAALKHLPLLEMHPSEAVKSNVFGTLNLLAICEVWQVRKFVNISTDKAADPISVLGYSKRIAERLTAGSAARGAVAVSVRFGNVLGSRGSVLTSFAEQIRAGGPVTVTHPDVTRYFMTVEEAVQLVIQAGAVGCPGQALVLDMGEPVRIADVARRLISRSQTPVELQFTGLRGGEKMHEVLLGSGEPDNRPVHRLITHVEVPPLTVADLDDIDLSNESLPRHELVRRLRALALSKPLQVSRPLEVRPAEAGAEAHLVPLNGIEIGEGRPRWPSRPLLGEATS
jgi:FlaA1/EpsC-like NDP-sugar epimerase